MNEKDALRIAREKIDSGTDPIQIIEICRKALSIVGDRSGKGEYFLSDMMVAAEIFREITEIIGPTLTSQPVANRRAVKVVIGTVQGDIHNLGKISSRPF